MPSVATYTQSTVHRICKPFACHSILKFTAKAFPEIKTVFIPGRKKTKLKLPAIIFKRQKEQKLIFEKSLTNSFRPSAGSEFQSWSLSRTARYQQSRESETRVARIFAGRDLKFWRKKFKLAVLSSEFSGNVLVRIFWSDKKSNLLIRKENFKENFKIAQTWRGLNWIQRSGKNPMIGKTIHGKSSKVAQAT